jgi:hypothetical protein
MVYAKIRHLTESKQRTSYCGGEGGEEGEETFLQGVERKKYIMAFRRRFFK